MSQLDSSDAVTCCINPGNARFKIFIYKNFSAFHLQVQFLPKKAFCIRSAANRHKYRICPGNDRLLLFCGNHAQTIRCFNPFHLCSRMNLHAALFHQYFQALPDFTVHRSEQTVHRLDHHHLTAKCLIQRSKLHTDDAAADNDKTLRQRTVPV